MCLEIYGHFKLHVIALLLDQNVKNYVSIELMPFVYVGYQKCLLYDHIEM